MLIFDALVGYFLFEVFGEKALWILGITCAVNFLRMSSNVNGFFKGMAQYFEDFQEEEE